MNKFVIIGVIVVAAIFGVAFFTIFSSVNIDKNNEYTTQELNSRHTKILEEFRMLKNNHSDGTIKKEQYLQEVIKLREMELKLYDDVQNHKFNEDEILESTGWYRGTMKFPSEIESELVDLGHSSMP